MPGISSPGGVHSGKGGSTAEVRPGAFARKYGPKCASLASVEVLGEG